MMTVDEMEAKQKAIIADLKETVGKMDPKLAAGWLFGLLDHVAMMAEDAETAADKLEES